MHLFPTSWFWSSDGLSLALRTVMVADGLGTDGFLGGCTCRIFNIELRAFNYKRLSLIVRVNVVLNRTVVVDSDWRFNNLCGMVIFRVKVSCITSVDGILLWLLIWLVNYVALLLVVCLLSRDVIGYEES